MARGLTKVLKTKIKLLKVSIFQYGLSFLKVILIVSWSFFVKTEMKSIFRKKIHRIRGAFTPPFAAIRTPVIITIVITIIYSIVVVVVVVIIVMVSK